MFKRFLCKVTNKDQDDYINEHIKPVQYDKYILYKLLGDNLVIKMNVLKIIPVIELI